MKLQFQSGFSNNEQLLYKHMFVCIYNYPKILKIFINANANFVDNKAC